MDIIFIDTSIFEANNFLEGKRIQEIYKLAERRDIRVIIPKLTHDEIINRIYKNIEEASQKFKKYRDDTRILRNASSLLDKFQEFNEDVIKKELFKNISDRFSKSNFEIIDYSNIDIEEVFKNYFEKTFPFGPGGKKNEFPDAFALKTVEKWAKTQDVKVLAFSKDNDILKYKSQYLEIIKDFESYLSNKIKEIEGNKYKKLLKKIEDIIESKSQNIKDHIKDWVEYQLEDESKYLNYSNYNEIHDISIIEIIIDIYDYNITSVTDDYISVELEISINYEVEIIVDDEDYMYKDEDTKNWVFFETKKVTVNEERFIGVDLIFSIESENNIVHEPEIEEINGGRNLNI